MGRNTRQKLPDVSQYRRTSENVDPVQGDERLEARYRLFEKRVPTEQSQQLFGVPPAA
jgi:hypothetical protein